MIISYLGVADYGPSKFAAVGFMKSLRQEILKLGKKGVHCSTVLPYHTDTEMFKGTATKRSIPTLNILDPNYVADGIVDAIEKNQTTVFLPRLFYLVVFVSSFMPDRALDALHKFVGTNEAMTTFKGHGKKQKST